MLMKIIQIKKAGISHPFGDERSVTQAFPAGISKEEADPFLMCDYFNSVNQDDPVSQDVYPVDWHPHRGFDIASYLKTGIGRHADSMGNRVTYETPGMQWMSTGSGVFHAEGGANSKNTRVIGFQIWVNVPSNRKLDDPRYGTVPPSSLPLNKVSEGVKARILAGPGICGETTSGPFETVQPIQMIDFEFQQNSTLEFDIAPHLDTAMIYLYNGSLAIIQENNQVYELQEGNIVLLDATSATTRGIKLRSFSQSQNNVRGGEAILFAGKKLKQPIAWHGPIVMTTKTELYDTFCDLRSGTFPPKRVAWDYKRASERPKN